MNAYYASAAVLAFLVGLVHSVLGEWLIFRRLRQGAMVPTKGGGLLDERHVRILWASWHVLTVFGWCIAFILLRLSLDAADTGSARAIAHGVIIAMLAGSALVFIGTRAKHPGWVGLLGVALLVWLGIAG